MGRLKKVIGGGFAFSAQKPDRQLPSGSDRANPIHTLTLDKVFPKMFKKVMHKPKLQFINYSFN
jgi:hypothetical protein